MFVVMKSRTSLKMGHVRFKTRSLGQISEKPYVHSIGHIFNPIIMKHGQNVFLDEMSDRFENESCWVKTRSLAQIKLFGTGLPRFKRYLKAVTVSALLMSSVKEFQSLITAGRNVFFFFCTSTARNGSQVVWTA